MKTLLLHTPMPRDLVRRRGRLGILGGKARGPGRNQSYGTLWRALDVGAQRNWCERRASFMLSFRGDSGMETCRVLRTVWKQGRLAVAAHRTRPLMGGMRK